MRIKSEFSHHENYSIKRSISDEKILVEMKQTDSLQSRLKKVVKECQQPKPKRCVVRWVECIGGKHSDLVLLTLRSKNPAIILQCKQATGDKPFKMSEKKFLGVPKSKQNKVFTANRLRMEQLWEEMKIEILERDWFVSCYCIRKRKNLQKVLEQIYLLVHFRSYAVNVLQYIHSREQALVRLTTLYSAIITTKVSVCAKLKINFLTELNNVLYRTCEVLKCVSQWRTCLWFPLPFIWKRNGNYIIKMQSDMKFLVRHFETLSSKPKDSTDGISNGTQFLNSVLIEKELNFLRLPNPWNCSEMTEIARGIEDTMLRSAVLYLVKEKDLQAEVQIRLTRAKDKGNFIPTMKWSPTQNAFETKFEPLYETPDAPRVFSFLQRALDEAKLVLNHSEIEPVSEPAQLVDVSKTLPNYPNLTPSGCSEDQGENIVRNKSLDESLSRELVKNEQYSPPCSLLNETLSAGDEDEISSPQRSPSVHVFPYVCEDIETSSKGPFSRITSPNQGMEGAQDPPVPMESQIEAEGIPQSSLEGYTTAQDSPVPIASQIEAEDIPQSSLERYTSDLSGEDRGSVGGSTVWTMDSEEMRLVSQTSLGALSTTTGTASAEKQSPVCDDEHIDSLCIVQSVRRIQMWWKSFKCRTNQPQNLCPPDLFLYDTEAQAPHAVSHTGIPNNTHSVSEGEKQTVYTLNHRVVVIQRAWRGFKRKSNLISACVLIQSAWKKYHAVKLFKGQKLQHTKRFSDFHELWKQKKVQLKTLGNLRMLSRTMIFNQQLADSNRSMLRIETDPLLDDGAEESVEMSDGSLFRIPSPKRLVEPHQIPSVESNLAHKGALLNKETDEDPRNCREVPAPPMGLSKRDSINNIEFSDGTTVKLKKGESGMMIISKKSSRLERADIPLEEGQLERRLSSMKGGSRSSRRNLVKTRQMDSLSDLSVVSTTNSYRFATCISPNEEERSSEEDSSEEGALVRNSFDMRWKGLNRATLLEELQKQHDDDEIACFYDSDRLLIFELGISSASGLRQQKPSHVSLLVFVDVYSNHPSDPTSRIKLFNFQTKECKTRQSAEWNEAMRIPGAPYVQSRTEDGRGKLAIQDCEIVITVVGRTIWKKNKFLGQASLSLSRALSCPTRDLEHSAFTFDLPLSDLKFKDIGRNGKTVKFVSSSSEEGQDSNDFGRIAFDILPRFPHTAKYNTAVSSLLVMVAVEGLEFKRKIKFGHLSRDGSFLIWANLVEETFSLFSMLDRSQCLEEFTFGLSQIHKVKVESPVGRVLSGGQSTNEMPLVTCETIEEGLFSFTFANKSDSDTWCKALQTLSAALGIEFFKDC